MDEQDRRLVIFPNPDKTGTHPSFPGPASVMLPARILFAGPPGVGKRNMILNFVSRMNPTPSAIHIVHIQGGNTKEYDILETFGAPIYFYPPEDFPTFNNLEHPGEAPVGDSTDDSVSSSGETHRPPEPEGACPIMIIDEITRDALSPESRTRFERLINFGSSHMNCTVLCSIQGITTIPPAARRGFNQFCLWEQPDSGATVMAATRAGLPPALLKELFELCLDSHDSIWVDTDKSPHDEYRFRLNFLTPIVPASAVTYDAE